MLTMEGRTSEAATAVIAQVLGVEFDRFPSAFLSALTEFVPVHHAGYYEVDPRVPSVEIMMHPRTFETVPSALEAGIRRYGEHPVAAEHARRGDGSALRISDVVSQEDYRSTAYYREVSAPVEAEYEMAFLLPGPAPISVVVVLSRSDRDFTDEERDLCNMLREPLASAHALAVRAGLLLQALRTHLQADPVTVLVGCEGAALVPLSSAGKRVVSRLLGPSDRPVPEVADWLLHAREGDLALDDQIPDRHHMILTDTFGTLEIRHIPGAGEGPDLLAVRDLDRDIKALLRGAGLRPREAEVLEMIMDGRTNHDIATAMGIAAATVKKHLERIYSTLEVSSRTAAAAAAFRTVHSDVH
jgi:DNA-binding CsgD family transcriptional regulator